LPFWKGGEATSKNHGKEFYQEIGRKGGEARGNSDQSDSDGKIALQLHRQRILINLSYFCVDGRELRRLCGLLLP
jgi:hypothetical protein